VVLWNSTRHPAMVSKTQVMALTAPYYFLV
jgi:hypothetical protein